MSPAREKEDTASLISFRLSDLTRKEGKRGLVQLPLLVCTAGKRGSLLPRPQEGLGSADLEEGGRKRGESCSYLLSRSKTIHSFCSYSLPGGGCRCRPEEKKKGGHLAFMPWKGRSLRPARCGYAKGSSATGGRRKKDIALPCQRRRKPHDVLFVKTWRCLLPGGGGGSPSLSSKKGASSGWGLGPGVSVREEEKESGPPPATALRGASFWVLTGNKNGRKKKKRPP